MPEYQLPWPLPESSGVEVGRECLPPGPREMGQGRLSNRNRLLAPGKEKDPCEVKTNRYALQGQAVLSK